jgi:hypothetical protein
VVLADSGSPVMVFETGLPTLISFYNEKVDIFLDGQPIERPVTHFTKDT